MAMKKILAVSGGIDSVVMLHLLKDERPIVAHFDHGIRPNSKEDAAFVEKLAKQYGLECKTAHAKLGSDCSESAARKVRYQFLEKLADEKKATICVAHHADDVLESIAINLVRGTGWRGLAPMGSPKIERPLLGWRKKDIYCYATEHRLSFRQDQTNTEDCYLRNRIREKMRIFPEQTKQKLLELYGRQTQIARMCDDALSEIAASNDSHYPKALILESPEGCAMEIMRFILTRNDISLTRPQLKNSIKAVKTFMPNKRLSLDRKHFLEVGKYSFRVL
jgi:tRNA(Ile)-lysidine synthase